MLFKKPETTKVANAPNVHRCGLFCWQPDFLQRCNNMTLFVFCYVLLCLIYGMAASYTSSMIPSIEKRFGFSSRTVGIIMAMNDVSHVSTALLTAHFGGRGHRPRWIMCGCIILGIALLLHAAPEVLFPFRNLDVWKGASMMQNEEHLCAANSRQRALRLGGDNHTAAVPVVNASESNIGPVVVLVVAQLLQGVGSTALIILGLPFIDDNVQKKNTPLYFSISFSSRIFGPVLGYALGGFCNSIFLDWTNPGFKSTDPRWISAWYLGYLFFGMGLCLFAITIGCFPASISSDCSKSEDESTKKEANASAQKIPASVSTASWKDLPRNIKRLVTNGAYVCRACSSMFDGVFIAGYFSFLPKFLGQQFQITQSAAAIAGGVPNVLATATGVVVGGFILRRWKPQPRYIGLFLAAGGLIMATTLYGLIGLECPQAKITGMPTTVNDSFLRSDGNATCHQPCQCKNDFIPVCDVSNHETFYSPCHAGCTKLGLSKNQEKIYENCMCVRTNGTKLDESSDQTPVASVVNGQCQKHCQTLYYYVAILTAAMFLGGLPLSGGIMLQFRIVDIDLKSMANGMTALLMAGLGFLPGPIIAGALFDSTCTLWQMRDNGETGYCLLYNTDAMRWKFHLFFASVRGIAVLMDLLLTSRIWKLKSERETPAGVPTLSGEDNWAFEPEVSEAVNENIYPPLKNLHLDSADHDTAHTRV
ncbi:solute carrier organic anion transporter family member 74D-like isoform X2 [Paramacrobiotus metropolitanus]|uniref:solute carrier organic anion transporter family member 74D-like isoform X2 n=1 Tax=Paramacrobiotus metropolitanus TaxID=2943436 RepID=UPI00244633C9|nr:solute carrier organic anion transporter family member 74D-like isoform X2 [Paramacrobiotus metropolitanus]